MENKTDKRIIDVKKGNVINKDTEDKVVLLGKYLYEDSLYVDDLEIVINQGLGENEITTKCPYGGYYLEIFLYDFDGDGKDEIMIRGDFGGSGGFAIVDVYDLVDKKLVNIFNQNIFTEKCKFTAKYLENYRVLVNSLALNEKYIFNILSEAKDYLGEVYDKDGKLKKFTEPTVSAINEAFPIKVTNKENYYLFIRQKVIGIANSDTIGYIESFVELMNNDFNIIEMGAYSFGEKDNLARSNNKKIIDKLPLGSVLTSKEKLGWKKTILEKDLDGDGINEYLIPYTLNDIPYIGMLKWKDDKYILVNSFKGEGKNIEDLKVKHINGKYYIFAGFKVEDNMCKLKILCVKNAKIEKAFKDRDYYYSKMYIDDLNTNGENELILWTQDNGEAYKINIYSISYKGIKKINKYDEIYFKKVVEYYKKLVEKYKDSSTYLYYLALAQEKIKDYKSSIKNIDKALNTKHPYPSLNDLKKLKKRIIKYIK